jgi:hypothetical protein
VILFLGRSGTAGACRFGRDVDRDGRAGWVEGGAVKRILTTVRGTRARARVRARARALVRAWTAARCRGAERGGGGGWMPGATASGTLTSPTTGGSEGAIAGWAIVSLALAQSQAEPASEIPAAPTFAASAIP